MSEKKEPNISVEEIMNKIKKEVEKRRYNNNSPDNTSFNDISSNAQDFINKSVYVYSDFTKYDNAEFIKNIYRGLLKREPETSGLQKHLNLLRSGERSKIELITGIRYSKEGRIKNVRLLGSKVRFIFYVLNRVPLLGTIMSFFSIIPSLAKTVRRLSMDQAHFSKQVDNIEEKINTLEFDFTKETGKLKRDLEDKIGENEIEIMKKQLDDKVGKQESKRLEYLINNKTSENEFKHLKKQMEDYAKTVAYAKEYMQIVQQNMQHLIEEAKKRLPDDVFDRQELQKLTEEEKHKYDAFYVEFEDKFRGSREDIKERVKVYLPYIEDLPFNKEEMEILDVGCGRGEWLELLQENGYKAKGIDLNRVMVSQCREAGLDVEEYDVIDYLSALSSDSLNVITGFHIIEHLPFETLMKLFEESYRVLKKGGMVIFETPNPENIIVGACNFYTDPTHRNPIPSHSAIIYLENTNFSKIKKETIKKNEKINSENPHFNDFYNDFINIYPDYSVIGYKT